MKESNGGYLGSRKLLLKEIPDFQVLEENKRRKLGRLLQCLEETEEAKSCPVQATVAELNS